MSVPTRTPSAPGRLGDPATTLETDPRADPRMLAVLRGLGLTGHPDPAPLGPDADRAALLGFVDAVEEGFEGLFAGLAASWTPVPGVTRELLTLQGDGGPITLHVHRPDGVDGPLPCLYQVHGGGMVMLSAEGPLYGHWRDELAAAGAVVVGVEYRNGGGRLGAHPFPAGLDDCVTGLRWVADHRDELGATHVVVTGDSGGANLALALALRARRDGYWLDRALFPLLAAVYDPEGEHAGDPTCWPFRAGPGDLAGLPPHVISCNELDPLRDEGLAYHRMLLAAGVPSVGRINPGLCHVGELMFREAMPDVYAAAVRDVVGFARSVA